MENGNHRSARAKLNVHLQYAADEARRKIDTAAEKLQKLLDTVTDERLLNLLETSIRWMLGDDEEKSYAAESLPYGKLSPTRDAERFLKEVHRFIEALTNPYAGVVFQADVACFYYPCGLDGRAIHSPDKILEILHRLK